MTRASPRKNKFASFSLVKVQVYKSKNKKGRIHLLKKGAGPKNSVNVSQILENKRKYLQAVCYPFILLAPSEL